MTVTQNDVAQRLGISQRAVAFAISDSPSARKQVSAATRKRVLEMAEELGYRPDRYAQVMRTGKSNVIGMVRSRSPIHAIGDRSRFAAMAIRGLGYQDLSYDIAWHGDELDTACNALIDARAEGVLLIGPDSEFPQAHISKLQAAGIPVVSFMHRPFPGVPRVLADNRQGMLDLVQHLLGLGYRRFTMIAPEAERSKELAPGSSISDRVAGFQEAALEPTVTQAEIVYQPGEGSSEDPYEPGYQAAARLLAGRRRPEALVCSNDYYAVGAFKACADLKIQVPDAMAIVGFDNAVVGKYMASPLTTVEQPIQAMATQAVHSLMEMIRGNKVLAQESLVKLPCRLVVRQSCGARSSGRSD